MNAVSSTLCLSTLCLSTLYPSTASGEPLSQQELLALGRIEHFAQRRQWEAAATELGRLPKAAHDDQAVQRYLRTIFPWLYGPRPPAPTKRGQTPLLFKRGQTPSALPWSRVTVQSRVTRRHMDAAENADQIFDERGWQYNNLWMAEGDHDGWRHTFRGSVDGYQNAKNDLRLRQTSYQLRRDDARITIGDFRNYLTTHKIVDPSNPLASYTGYTLRSTQMRGIDLQLTTDRNDFHLMAGAAPFFLSPSDEYIYPRKIFGIRDSYKLTSWYRAALGGSYVRDDDERIEHIDPAIQPRETGILSFEQDVTLIPGHWAINSEHAYSVTDDNFRPNRFGDNVKLKDFAHSAFSEWRWPAIRILGSYERIGPDFRAPSDIAAIGTISSKYVTADREHLTLRVYPRRIGRLYGNLLYARTQNDLDDDSEVELTREHWMTATGGLQLPKGWPQPGFRTTFIRTISVPGSTFSADKRWLFDLLGELRYRGWETDWTAGYQFQEVDAQTIGFDDDYRRTYHLQASRGLWPGGYLSTRWAWSDVHDRFNNTTPRQYSTQEAGATLSSRLWSTASLSASFTHQDLGTPFVNDPVLQSPGGGIVDTISSAFVWPYTKRFRGGRTLSLMPSLHVHHVDASDDLQQHPTVGARFTARWAVRNDWRWEFLLEHRQGDDQELRRANAQEWRGWLVVTSKFGQPLVDESRFR